MVGGGWFWIFLPLILMLVGSNIVWGIFFALTGDPSEAGAKAFRIGPFLWSFLQVVLLLIAIRGLKSMGISFAQIIGFRKSSLLSDIVRALSLSAAGIVIVLSVTHLIELLSSIDGSLTFYPWAIVWWTTAGSITAGLGEEVYFRGFLMERLSWMEDRWLVLITALSFALWHGNPVLFPHTFLIGVIFAYSYIRWKRLFPLILAHTLIDMVGGVMMLLSKG